jgi:hypothetical protein
VTSLFVAATTSRKYYDGSLAGGGNALGAERHHDWLAERFKELDARLLVCEPVLAEAMNLLARSPKAPDAVLELIGNGAQFRLMSMSAHCANCFRNTGTRRRRWPMHACSYVGNRHAVLTLDCDFLVYRKHGRTSLPLIHPAAQ